MTKSTMLAALLLAVPAARADEPATPAGWALIHDADGVTVYQRREEGLKTIALRGEATIDASPKAIFEVMRDNAEAHEWMPLVVAKRDLKPVNETERVEYTHIGMPWPLTDRYFINQGKVEFMEKGVIRLSVRSVDEQLVKEDDKVLGVLHHSEFLLTPIDDGAKTRMTLEVNADPKGMIPKWLVNAAQKSWPIDFFKGLVKQLGKHGKLGAPVAH